MGRQESSVKYFYLSTYNSSLILLSVVLLYALAQTVNLSELNQWLSQGFATGNADTSFSAPLLYVAVLSLIVGFSFKLSSFPSHH